MPVSEQTGQDHSVRTAAERTTQRADGLAVVGGQAALYLLAELLNRGSVVLLLPLYTRFMPPTEYGILGLASIITSLLVMLLSFGGNSVVTRFYHQFEDAHERARFLGTFWLFLIVLPALALVGLYLLAAGPGAFLFADVALHPYLELVLATTYLNIAFGTVPASLMRVQERAGAYFMIAALSFALTLTFSFYFVAYSGGGAVGALSAQFAALVIGSLASSLAVKRAVRVTARPRHLASSLGYSLPLVPHLGAHWLLSVSDRAIIERVIGLASLGLYSLAYQFGTAMQVLISAVNQALMPRFSKAAGRPEELAGLGRLSTYYLLVVVLIGAAVAATAGELIKIVTPPSYHAAGDLVPFIALGIVAMGFYFVPMNALSMTAGKTRVVPVLTLTAGLLNVSLNLLLVPKFGTLAAAINTAAGYGLLAILTSLYAARAVHIPYEKQRIAKIMAAGLLAVVFTLPFGGSQPLPALLIKGAALTSFPALLWLMGFWTPSERAGLALLFRRAAIGLGTILPGH